MQCVSCGPKKAATDRIFNLIKTFDSLASYDKHKRGPTFMKKLEEYLKDIDKLFDIFCHSAKQQRNLEKKHKLCMTEDDFKFYKDQKGPTIGKCPPVTKELTMSDIKFIRSQVDHASTTAHAACQPSTSSECREVVFSDTDSAASIDTTISRSSEEFQALNDTKQTSEQNEKTGQS